MRTKDFCLLTLCLVLAAGCGGPTRPTTVPVRGIVTLDGAPIADAAVMFMPSSGGRPAMGTTDAAGKFTLMTFTEGDGALVGDHKVTVTLRKIVGVTSEDGLSGTVAPGGAQDEWVVPERYSTPETSGLTAKVEPNMPEVKYQLTKE